MIGCDNKYYAVDYGWENLVNEIIRLVDIYNYLYPSPTEFVKIIDIKEKFGILSVTLNYYPHELFVNILKLESESEKICEHCGTTHNVKTIDTHGWIMTLCDTCRQNENQLFKNRYQLIPFKITL